ncbi:endogenous retrovirus group K member 10 Pro protein-like [Prinia subflava]|uniref:endogenous retrovirus group K member 10 Pro protein-like n=1 Tax=Prinia subflava TaxID=208062 RepID=UPI002FE00ABA
MEGMGDCAGAQDSLGVEDTYSSPVGVAADAVAGPAVSGVQPVPSRVPASDPVGPTGQDMSSVSRTEDWSRGDSGFGSTGPPQVHWTTVLTKDHPEMMCTVTMAGATPSEIHPHSLLDTGANVTIFSLAAWPPQWPLSLVQTPILALGGTKQCYVSQNPVVVTNPEGQTAMIWPHVTDTAKYLWGRAVLAMWGVRISTDF